MSARIPAALLLVIMCVSVTRAETVVDVRVFTTSFIQVADRGHRADASYFLDDVERALARLAKGLPTELEKLPAILINDQYVIYGIRDVDEALRLFAESRP